MRRAETGGRPAELRRKGRREAGFIRKLNPNAKPNPNPDPSHNSNPNLTLTLTLLLTAVEPGI